MAQARLAVTRRSPYAIEFARAPVAQLDRALASGAKGYRFDSCRAHQPLLRPRAEPRMTSADPPPADHRFKPHATREMAEMFDDVSARYDCLNRLMTLGRDAAWREAMWREVPDRARVVLDLCTGSGASLGGLRQPGRLVIGADVSLGMLRVAREQAGWPGWAPRLVAADGF